jgi:hypothetical protein
MRIGRHAAAIGLLLAGTSSASDPPLVNASFEELDPRGGLAGWHVLGNGRAIHVDRLHHTSGRQGVTIASTEPGNIALLYQRFSAAVLSEGPMQLTGLVRTSDVAVCAALVVMVDAWEGQLYLDDMRDRPITGTALWTHYSVTVPKVDNATIVTIGVLLHGTGTASFDDLRLVRP